MSFWDKEKTIKVIEKNNKGDEIHIKLVEKKGAQYVDVRTFYEHKESGERRPGKGISIPVDSAPEVQEAIGEAYDTTDL